MFFKEGREGLMKVQINQDYLTQRHLVKRNLRNVKIFGV